MYLEDVIIEGFKSFSEPTEMSFQPGIGVIMGNNGVGKSNILDAIVWALGEDDHQRLRCYHRQEMFFSGSKAYDPATKVRVELKFKSGPEAKKPVLSLVREMTKPSTESTPEAPAGIYRHRFIVNGSDEPAERYRSVIDRHLMRDALLTIIRQEEINDLVQLDPFARFSAVGRFLGTESAQELADRLRQEIEPTFLRYMAYLMPPADIHLDTPTRNGDLGLDVVVTLPGNRIRRAHQLSGGEKSITSLALKLALFHRLQSPFFLLDEVEPALDYTNHKSMQAFLKDVAGNKQLIMITHLRSTIELADTLHGVRTRFDGSSFMKFYFVMDQRLLRLYKCC